MSDKIPQLDNKFTLRISEMFLQIYNVSIKCEVEIPNKVFDFVSLRLLSLIYATTLKNKNMSARISTVELSRKLGKSVSRMTVSRKIQDLATWGFIRCNTYDWKVDQVQRETTLITMNPNIQMLFTSPVKTMLRTATFKEMITNGRQKQELGDIDSMSYQGFTSIQKFGYPEGGEHTVYNFSTQLSPTDEQLDDLRTAKDLKRIENKNWLDWGKRLVSGCASLWVKAQTVNGMGEQVPAWGENHAYMTAAAKREYKELTKTCETFGGGITALAWYVFCEATPDLDDNGNPKFDRDTAFKQCVFSDKRPSQFAKNFSSILNSKEFKKYSTTSEWWQGCKDDLRTWFDSDILELEPREGNHRDKLGYSLGDEHIRP